MIIRDEARAIRAEGERAIKLMQANQSPYCDGWERWSPPVEWEIPGLPVGWDNMMQDHSSEEGGQHRFG